MAQRKKETSSNHWVDVKDHSKGFKMNFSTVIYLELGRTFEGYKQAEFIGLKNPALALDYAYPEHFFLSSDGLILHKTASGKFEVIAKTDKC